MSPGAWACIVVGVVTLFIAAGLAQAQRPIQPTPIKFGSCYIVKDDIVWCP